MTIKYLASYHGAGYGLLDQEYMDGFKSLYDTMQAMRNRQSGRDWVYTYREDLEGVYHPHPSGQVAIDFPCNTRDDYMDVYYAITEDDGYILGEWAYRITVGPRGGIRTERA